MVTRYMQEEDMNEDGCYMNMHLRAACIPNPNPCGCCLDAQKFKSIFFC